MKKILTGLLIQLFVCLSVCAQTGNAESLASKMAQRMKDSLSLTESQKGMLYNINMQLHQQKQTAWQQYGQDSSLTVHIQRIENTRDSLYKPVLTEPQFLLYREKKGKLITNN